jgi:hypothetical protein
LYLNLGGTPDVSSPNGYPYGGVFSPYIIPTAASFSKGTYTFALDVQVAANVTNLGALRIVLENYSASSISWGSTSNVTIQTTTTGTIASGGSKIIISTGKR